MLKPGGIAPRKHFDTGGITANDESSFHGAGLFNSLGAGRTDIHNRDVPPGGYVIPADVVSGLSEGNTLSGSALLDRMFNTEPAGVAPGTGPNGMKLKGGRGHADFPREQTLHMPHLAPSAEHGVAETEKRGGLTGKKKHMDKAPVPVVVAGGEYYVPPEAIAAKFGDLDRGHKIMDQWVVHRRKKNIKELSKLPGPKK